MIKSFDCCNFRNVCCQNLDFERINILIGPNNAGKSNFIRALSFVANMVNGEKKETTGFYSELKRNGWNSVANRRVENATFEFLWNFQLAKDQPVEYKLAAHVGSSREDNYIITESLDGAEARVGAIKPYNYFNCHSETIGKGLFSSAGMSNAQNKRLHADVSPYESVLLQMDNLFFENKELFSNRFVRDEIRNVLESMRMYFRSFYSYSCTNFNLSAIREMQDAQNDGRYLLSDGSNFVNVFYSAQQKNQNFKNNYEKLLHKLIGNFEGLEVCNAAGKLWMELRIGGAVFSLPELSDGTIHLLLLLLLLNLPEGSGISMLAIDEPEMNLHPAWQKLFATEILRCNSFKQCYISTHSPDFLDEFTEGFLDGSVGVFVFDPSKKTTIRKLDRQQLQSELDGWTLGDLYRIGDPVIGGWPQ